MITVILGRTGSGKSTLAGLLAKSGLKVAKTYTTRPKRSPDEDGYHFVTPEEAAAFEDKVIPTTINGYEYFVAGRDLDACDVIVADVNGLKGIAQRMPGSTVHVVYVEADPEQRKLNAVRRARDKISEEQVFDSRSQDEDGQFSDFEEMLRAKRIPLPNCTRMTVYPNKFDMDDITAFASILADSIREHACLRAILAESVELDIFRKNPETGEPVVTVLDDRNETKQVSLSLDALADKFLADDGSPVKDLFMSYAMVSPRFKDLLPGS